MEASQQGIKLDNKMLGLIRTTSRNNVERINIADQKASTLMSLNAIIITVMVPLLLSYIDVIYDRQLYIPILLLSINSLVTLYMASKALKPKALSSESYIYDKDGNPSPFFFGNFYKMSKDEYRDYFQSTLSDEELLPQFVFQDLFHIGKLVARKYVIIRQAYLIFMTGLVIVVLSTAVVLMVG